MSLAPTSSSRHMGLRAGDYSRDPVHNYRSIVGTWNSSTHGRFLIRQDDPERRSFERGLGRFELSFDRNLHPMLVADDARRYVDANRAACLLLGRSRRELLELRVDDLTPPELRAMLPELWTRFVAEGIQAGTYELLLPDGGRVEVDYSATANISPGRHLSILVPAYMRDEALHDEETEPATASPAPISGREREVLELVAEGKTSAEIAAALHLSPETVRTHLGNARTKLGARNRPHAVALALEQGLIGLEGLPVAE
jgi:PAS domain S-box-containing protein